MEVAFEISQDHVFDLSTRISLTREILNLVVKLQNQLMGTRPCRSGSLVVEDSGNVARRRGPLAQYTGTQEYQREARELGR